MKRINFIIILLLFISCSEKKHTQYYENGQLQVEGIMKRGKTHGEWNSYYRNGQLESSTNYKDGIPHGKDIRYYKNGEIEYIYNYKDGRKNGTFVDFYENGQKNKEIIYGEKYEKDYELYGIYIEKEYYENGQLKNETEFIAEYEESFDSWTDKERNGKSTSYYENGQLEVSANYKDGERDGDYISYYENGLVSTKSLYKMGEYVEGIDYKYNKDGKIVTRTYNIYQPDSRYGSENKGKVGYDKYEYYNNGQIRSETFSKNKEKITNDYTKNGQIEREKHLKDGTTIKNIEYTYHQNGEMKSNWSTKNGRTGLVTYFYDNSQIESEGNLTLKGSQYEKKEGNWKYFYENGKIKEKSNYYKDELDGKFLAYYENGQVKIDANFSSRQKMYDDPNNMFKGMDIFNFLPLQKLLDELDNDLLNEYGGIPDGKMIFYYEDGKKYVEQNFDNGLLDGKFTSFYENGQIFKEVNYYRGEYDGRLIMYYEDGQISMDSYFKSRKGNDKNLYEKFLYDENDFIAKYGGRPHGKTITYHENGQIKAESDWEEGKLIGNIIEYDENGDIFKGEKQKRIYNTCQATENDFIEMVAERLERMNVQYLDGQGAKYLGDCRYSITGRVLDNMYNDIKNLNWTFQFSNGQWILE